MDRSLKQLIPLIEVDVDDDLGGYTIRIVGKGLTSKELEILLPHIAEKYPSCRVLNLSLNKLSYVPDAVFDLPRLENLYAEHNDLTSLPETVANARRLAVIYLDGNAITSLPEEILHLPALERLAINKNLLDPASREIFDRFSDYGAYHLPPDPNTTEIDLSTRGLDTEPVLQTDANKIDYVPLLKNILYGTQTYYGIKTLDLRPEAITNLLIEKGLAPANTPPVILSKEDLAFLLDHPRGMKRFRDLTTLDLSGHRFANLPEDLRAKIGGNVEITLRSASDIDQTLVTPQISQQQQSLHLGGNNGETNLFPPNIQKTERLHGEAFMAALSKNPEWVLHLGSEGASAFRRYADVLVDQTLNESDRLTRLRELRLKVIQAFAEKTDPTGRVADINKSYPFIEWICRQTVQSPSTASFDPDTIKTLLKTFDGSKKHLQPLETIAGVGKYSPSQIEYYQNLDHLTQVVTAHEQKKQIKLSEQERKFAISAEQKEKIDQGTKILVDDPKLGKVIWVTTPEAAKYHTHGTKMCINSEKSSQDWFATYNPNAPIIILMPPENGKDLNGRNIQSGDGKRYHLSAIGDGRVYDVENKPRHYYTANEKLLIDLLRQKYPDYPMIQKFVPVLRDKPDAHQIQLELQEKNEVDRYVSDPYLIKQTMIDSEGRAIPELESLYQRGVLAKILDLKPEIYNDLPLSLKLKKDLVRTVIQADVDGLAWISNTLEKAGRLSEAEQYRAGISQADFFNLSSDRDLLLLSKSGQAWDIADGILKQDRDFQLAMIKKSYLNFERILPNVPRDMERDFILAAAKQSGRILKNLGDTYRKDIEIVFAAIEQDPRSVYPALIHDDLLASPDFQKAFLAKFPFHPQNIGKPEALPHQLALLESDPAKAIPYLRHVPMLQGNLNAMMGKVDVAKEAYITAIRTQASQAAEKSDSPRVHLTDQELADARVSTTLWRSVQSLAGAMGAEIAPREGTPLALSMALSTRNNADDVSASDPDQEAFRGFENAQEKLKAHNPASPYSEAYLKAYVSRYFKVSSSNVTGRDNLGVIIDWRNNPEEKMARLISHLPPDMQMMMIEGGINIMLARDLDHMQQIAGNKQYGSEYAVGEMCAYIDQHCDATQKQALVEAFNTLLGTKITTAQIGDKSTGGAIIRTALENDRFFAAQGENDLRFLIGSISPRLPKNHPFQQFVYNTHTVYGRYTLSDKKIVFPGTKAADGNTGSAIHEIIHFMDDMAVRSGATSEPSRFFSQMRDDWASALQTIPSAKNPSDAEKALLKATLDGTKTLSQHLASYHPNEHPYEALAEIGRYATMLQLLYPNEPQKMQLLAEAYPDLYHIYQEAFVPVFAKRAQEFRKFRSDYVEHLLHIRTSKEVKGTAKPDALRAQFDALSVDELLVLNKPYVEKFATAMVEKVAGDIPAADKRIFITKYANHLLHHPVTEKNGYQQIAEEMLREYLSIRTEIEAVVVKEETALKPREKNIAQSLAGYSIEQLLQTHQKHPGGKHSDLGVAYRNWAAIATESRSNAPVKSLSATTETGIVPVGKPTISNGGGKDDAPVIIPKERAGGKGSGGGNIPNTHWEGNYVRALKTHGFGSAGASVVLGGRSLWGKLHPEHGTFYQDVTTGTETKKTAEMVAITGHVLGTGSGLAQMMAYLKSGSTFTAMIKTVDAEAFAALNAKHLEWIKRAGNIGIAGLVITSGASVADAVAGYEAGDGKRVTDALGGTAGGIAGGMLIGAGVGSVVPVFGTVAGALVGLSASVGGAMVGSWMGAEVADGLFGNTLQTHLHAQSDAMRGHVANAYRRIKSEQTYLTEYVKRSEALKKSLEALKGTALGEQLEKAFAFNNQQEIARLMEENKTHPSGIAQSWNAYKQSVGTLQRMKAGMDYYAVTKEEIQALGEAKTKLEAWHLTAVKTAAEDPQNVIKQEAARQLQQSILAIEYAQMMHEFRQNKIVFDTHGNQYDLNKILSSPAASAAFREKATEEWHWLTSDARQPLVADPKILAEDYTRLSGKLNNPATTEAEREKIQKEMLAKQVELANQSAALATYRAQINQTMESYKISTRGYESKGKDNDKNIPKTEKEMTDVLWHLKELTHEIDKAKYAFGLPFNQDKIQALVKEATEKNLVGKEFANRVQEISKHYMKSADEGDASPSLVDNEEMKHLIKEVNTEFSNKGIEIKETKDMIEMRIISGGKQNTLSLRK